MKIGAGFIFQNQCPVPAKAADKPSTRDGVSPEQLRRARVLQDLSSTNEVRLVQLEDGRRMIVKTGDSVVDAESALIQEAEARKEEMVHRIGLLVGRAFVPRPTILPTADGTRSTIVTPEIDTGRSQHSYKEAFHGLGDTDEARTLLGKYRRDGLSVFDFIVGHGDRFDEWGARGSRSPSRMKNVLIDRGGRLHSIDHESAFRTPPFPDVSDAAVLDFFKEKNAYRDFRGKDLKRMLDDAFLELVHGDRGALDQLLRDARIDTHGVARRAEQVIKQYEAMKADEGLRLAPAPKKRGLSFGWLRAKA
ncbi:hypothetical protein CDL60_07035 [Roseateles noduli]|nr:hypothetical protein CDL60_07035 [Roseateles noduli]